MIGWFPLQECLRVQVATDGSLGLARARRPRSRANLLDVMMPGIDGWSVSSEIKADPDPSATPVVVCTLVDQRSLAGSTRAADYMLKLIN